MFDVVAELRVGIKGLAAEERHGWSSLARSDRVLDVLGATERLEAERSQFEQARMARRVIERLREQRREAWGEELSRHEQGVSDEVGLQRSQRNGQEAT